jgi:uncharacterized membrane protein (UPF0127 family)
MRSARAASALAVVVLLAGCADDSTETSSSATTPDLSVASVANPIDLAADGPTSDSGRVTIPGFDEVGVEVTNDAGEVLEWCLLLAAAAEQFAQGLMNVVDLGEYAGMLFDFPADTEGDFWMRDTPMPLTIAFLDAEGAIVSTADMDPCLDLGDQCPGYPPEGVYNDTVEVPQGGLEALGLDGPAARLVQTGSCPPI